MNFMIVAMTILVLSCIFMRIRASLVEVEIFDNLLGGYIDLRYGSLGGNAAATANAWINVATVTLSKASQTVNAVLEVYGASRQTFSLTLSNSATAALPPKLLQSNGLGDDKLTFSAAKVVPSAINGLTSRYDLFLKMTSNNVSGVPIAWYLQGVGTADTISTSDQPVVAEPSGGVVATVSVSSSTPVGTVLMFGSTTLPSGYLLCNGALISRLTYSDLFAVIGTTYGGGDGKTTFALPDFRSRVPVGSGAGTGLTNRALGATGGEENHLLTTNEMPSHSHGASSGWMDRNSSHSHGMIIGGIDDKNFTGVGGQYPVADGPGAWTNGTTTQAADTNHTHSISVSASGGGGSHNVMQPFLGMNFIIKV